MPDTSKNSGENRAPIQLELLAAKTRQTLNCTFNQACRLGSAKSNDVVIAGETISAHHARIFVTDDGAVFIGACEGAAVAVNGTVADKPLLVTAGDWVLLGSTPFQVKFNSIPQPLVEVGDASSQHIDLSGKSVLTVGRLPQCDIAIASPLISREHARLVRAADGWFIEDSGSTNGTFLNAVRVLGRQALKAHDWLSFAAFEYQFDGQRIIPGNQAGQVNIEVYRLSKEVRDASGQTKRLLDDLSFAIRPGEFVGIFGTSGSGKSTLLDALNGRRRASSGDILYNGTDLYGAFDLFRAAIGYVPQQDIVHRKIIMRHALKFTAKLRLPPDTSDVEMDDNVLKVLEKVGLAEKASLAVDTPTPLSGGQLKRVSLAVELVANPNVLFLDEVTSGLDAGTDKKMMQLFRSLAEDKKTVICVTHTLENIDTCHLVLLLHQGRLVFFGPPQAVVGYFGMKRLSDVYELLESQVASYWADKYQASSFYHTYVAQRLNFSGQRTDGATQTNSAQPSGKPVSQSLRQTRTLILRYCELMLSDRKNLLILVLQAPLIALIIGLVFEMDAQLALRAAKQSQILFILVLSAIWFGCLNSARELVKELPIYIRERSVNLGLGPYIASKLIPLSLLCLLQCLLLLGVIALLIDVPGNFPQRLLILFASGMAATTMGLCVSAFVNSNDKAVATVPILLIPQVILSGAVVTLEGAGLWIAKLSMISYWSFDAMKATLSEEVRAVKDFTGKALVPIAGSFGLDLLAIAALGLFFLLATGIGLKLKDTKK
ncbi:MAG: ABC transporter ATP-binding protein [Gammaproteobacteria bacterium HGW-Gammaproteobacteria-3]|nr:MAG: ABC transporter ATP-binding protein [Gammaproteobacteria bacterium HGW-Gammaproteobacteria-3]